MARYRTTITTKDREAMLDLVRKHKIQVFDHGNRYTEKEGYVVGAVLGPVDIQKLEDAGYRVERHEDVEKHGKARQKEVGHGDRYRNAEPR
jgi:hypothetical protein